jgi:hypothetical protein
MSRPNEAASRYIGVHMRQLEPKWNQRFSSESYFIGGMSHSVGESIAARTLTQSFARVG